MTMNNILFALGNSTVNQTPKKAVIGGVRFTRSKNGNLWRAGLIRAFRSVYHSPFDMFFVCMFCDQN